MNWRRMGLGTLLAATMAGATFAPVAFAVLATVLRSEFGVARWQIGALVTAVMVTGALLSPMAGTLADRMVPRYSIAVTLVLSGFLFIGLGLSPNYWWMVVVALFGGFAQAMSNPSTNRLIMTQAEAGRRGMLTGIKQSGVQAGNFLVGILFPLGLVSGLGRQGTLLVGALVPGLTLALLGWLVRGRPAVKLEVGKAKGEKSSPVVMRLAVYSALAGVATGSLTTYLPSFAQETFGWSLEAGGALVSVFAGVAFVTRLTAGSLSERFFGHHRTLVGMALVTAVAGVILATAPTGGWLWPAAVLLGLGPMAFNVVANLAVMELSPEGAAGRGSGVMMAGFLAGVGIGAPLLGWSTDLLGTYRPGWWVVAVIGVVAAFVGRRIRKEIPASA